MTNAAAPAEPESDNIRRYWNKSHAEKNRVKEYTQLPLHCPDCGSKAIHHPGEKKEIPLAWRGRWTATFACTARWVESSFNTGRIWPLQHCPKTVNP